MFLSILTITGGIVVSTLFGSMIFFSCVVAPLIFIKLDSAVAGQFVRSIFPWYYVLIIVLASIACLCFAPEHPTESAIMALIAVCSVFTRQHLMPAINKHRDLMLEGAENAGYMFNRLHRYSVWINSIKILAVLGMLLHLWILFVF